MYKAPTISMIDPIHSSILICEYINCAGIIIVEPGNIE